jgi:sulfofructose kinase
VKLNTTRERVVVVKKLDALFVGAANLDRIAVVDRIPGADERVISEAILIAGGGPAATAAVAAARQGLSVGFVGVVGRDANGKLVRDFLASESVDVTGLIEADEFKTPESILLVEKNTGLRTIVTEEAPVPIFSITGLPEAEWVHVDQTGYRVVHALAKTGKLASKLSLDGGNEISELILSNMTLFAPTQKIMEARYPGQSVQAAMLAAQVEGAQNIVVTAGSNGAWYLDDSGPHHVPAFSVKVLSTLGAGDVFHGALVAGLVKKMTLQEAVVFASATAALSCLSLDGRSGIPRYPETMEFLVEHGVKLPGAYQK